MLAGSLPTVKLPQQHTTDTTGDKTVLSPQPRDFISERRLNLYLPDAKTRPYQPHRVLAGLRLQLKKGPEFWGVALPFHVVMEPASYMQSVLSPNPASTIYASTAAVPGYQIQAAPQPQTSGSLINGNVVAGSKRPYEAVVNDVNGHGQHQSFQQRPPPLNLNLNNNNNNAIVKGEETPSRDESHPRDGDSSTASPAGAGEMYPKKKQKRNKPTLSCFECVERKTKVCFYLFTC